MERPIGWLALRRLLVTIVACAMIMLTTATTAPVRAANVVSLAPDPSSGASVGTMVTWTATATGTGSLRYRFSVAKGDGPSGLPFLVMRDFSPSNIFTWTPMDEGTYRVKATVLDETGLPGVAESTASYAVTTRITGSDAVVSPTTHPLVALYSIPPCTGQARVEFRGASGAFFQTTHIKPCRPGLSVNFFVAGMRADTDHVLRHVITDGGSVSQTKSFRTGTPTVAFPASTIDNHVDSDTSLLDDVLLQSVLVGPQPGTGFALATDLAGNVIWYHDEARFGDHGSLFRPVHGGTLLVAAPIVTPSGVLNDQLLREIDLIGSTMRETNVERVNQQLAARNSQYRITSIHHEANRLPNGDTVVLASVEEVRAGVQGATGPVDIYGEMILVLDLNWQVKWTWSAFDHLDINRKAILGETCEHQSPGCPPLVKAIGGKANDWLHGNAVTYSAHDGNFLFSMRHQDWVIKIDYRNGAGTGNVLWRLGHEGDFQLPVGTPATSWFSHQHDASFVSPNHITLYDNSNSRCAPTEVPIPGCNSRGQVYSINEATKRANLVVNVDLGAYSLALGSAERLSNGNYSFGSGFLGTRPINHTQAIEARPNGSLDYVQRTQAAVYRSFRMKSLYVAR